MASPVEETTSPELQNSTPRTLVSQYVEELTIAVQRRWTIICRIANRKVEDVLRAVGTWYAAMNPKKVNFIIMIKLLITNLDG